ncbi:MAG: diaminopimelate epimerase [candidate division Zixibacteria bacterium]|nr:diaminopimelate epimerase [candidate division Zixibacteria bacterium]
MEGFGNCYIFAEAKYIKKLNLRKLACAVSDKDKGIGADGLIIVDSTVEPFVMRIFNLDGSEAEMCGNGLRMAALFLKRASYPNRKKFTLATSAGEFPAKIISSKANKAIVNTSMGSPDFKSSEVGIGNNSSLAFDIPLMEYSGKQLTYDCVSMGNPHAVVFVKSFEFDWPKLARGISEDKMFSRGINVNFLKIINSKRFKIKTYERGSGATSACGSGAAACLAVGVMRNILQKKAVAVMSGGNLELAWDMSANTINQTGPATIICRGEYYN